MAKKIIKFLDDLSPSELKLRGLPRKPDGLYNLAFNEYGQEVKRAGYSEYNKTVIGTSSTLTGTVAVNKSSTAVVGTDTAFTTDLVVGDLIKIVAEIFTVSVITNDTNLTLDSAYQGANASGVTAYHLHKILGMHRFYKQDTSSKEFIVAWNTSLYKLAETTPWGATALIRVSTTVDADSASGQTVLNVTTTNGFVVGESVIINKDGAREETKVIASIQTGVSLTMTVNLTYTHTGAQADTVYTTLTADSDTYFADFANHCYIVNGVNTMMKYNMTNVRTVGITVPGAPTFNANIDGSLTAPDFNEIHTQANAASDPNTNEANATTGWAGVGCTLTSVTTDPQTGTYHLKGVAADGNADRIEYDFTAISGYKYYISFWAKRGAQGTVQNISSWTGVTTSPNEAIAVGDWAEYTYEVTANDTTIKIRIYAAVTGGAAGDEVYVDNVSIKEILDEAGTYYYKYTFVDEDGYESNGGTASAAMTAEPHPHDGITINIAASGDAKIAKRRIYRTTVGGSIYYYDGEVNNVVTTYDSTISDEEISLKSVLHTDHNAPPGAPSLVVKRSSRINIAVDDDLYVSKNYDKTTGVRSVEYFPSTNYFPTGNGQKITGLMEQLSELPLFTENTIERLVGTDEDNFELRNAHQEDGNIAKRSAVNYKNYGVYLSFNGIYIFDGVSARAIDVAFGGRLNKYIRDNINYSYAHLSCAACYDNKYLLCIPTGESPVPNTTIYFDFATMSYGIYSFAFSCFCKFDKGGDGLRLFGGSNTEGRVYEIFTGLNDDTENITCYDRIESFDGGSPDKWKQFYHIYIKVKSTTGTALTMYYTLDDGSETSKSLTMTANKTLWYKIDLIGGGQRARAISWRPYVSDKCDITIMGYAIVFEEEPPEWS